MPSTVECFWLIATVFGQFGCSFSNQSWKLLKDLFDWVDQFLQLMFDQLKRIRSVEKNYWVWFHG